MSKKMRYMLLVVLLIVPLVLAACGGDDDDGDDNDSGIKLTQTVSSASGLSVKYPASWIGGEDDGGILFIANNQASYDKMADGDGDFSPEAGEAGVIVLVPDLADYGLSKDSDLDTVHNTMVALFAAGGFTELGGGPENIKVGGADARKVALRNTADGSDGLLVVMIKNDTAFVGVLSTEEGEIGQFEDTALAIIGSATYSAP